MKSRIRQRKLLIRRIQYWLSKHEYMSGYGFLLCASNDKEVAICRAGIIDSIGHACVIEPWKKFTLTQIKRAFHLVSKGKG